MTTVEQSYVIYTAGGSTAAFIILNPYLATSHIQVWLSTNGGASYTQTTAFTFSAEDTPTQVILTSTPASGTLVKILRVTPHPTPLVTFADDSPITAANIDKVIKQALYYAEEVEDLS